MQTNDNAKSFAFKLSKDVQQTKEGSKPVWQVRDRVAVAGCTGPDMRADGGWPFFLRDDGVYC